MKNWRDPIIAHPEEVSGQFSRPGERALLWYVTIEDRERIRRLMACASCLQVFPAPPEKRNLHIFRAEGVTRMFTAARSPEEVEALISAGKCPACQTEVSQEMLRLMDVGDDYNDDPKRYEALIDEREREIWERDRLRAIGATA
jgi:hypothetical protein